MKNFPKITLSLITFNGGEGVRRCLESVRLQDYPKDKIEIIVIDNGSIDKTVEIAKIYTDKIYISFDNPYKNRQDSMKLATGKYVYMILEQDIELRDELFLQKMVEPLEDDPKIVGSFTREYPHKGQSWVTRFLSHNPALCDPLYEYMTPSVERTFIEEKENYTLCRFAKKVIPPFGRMLYRVKDLKQSPVWKQTYDFDDETLFKLVKSGKDFFAYVPQAGIYHYHADSLSHLIKKRMYNLRSHYFPHNKSAEYTWINFSKKADILKMFIWVIYANLFIPATVRGFLRFLKYKDYAFLFEPILTIAITDAVLIAFVRDSVGRNLLIQGFRTIFKFK